MPIFRVDEARGVHEAWAAGVLGVRTVGVAYSVSMPEPER